jgi:hypothetical protein
MPTNVEPPEVILGPSNRVHLVVATQEPLSDPGSWKPFLNEVDVTVRELLDKLPESDIHLKELLEKWKRPKPEFFIVDVRLEDFQLQQLHRIANQEEDLKIVRDIVCEAVVVIMPEYETMRGRVDEPYRRPRHYIIIVDELSQDQITAITNLMASGCRCRECYQKRNLEMWFREVWLAASSEMMNLDVARQIIRS